MADPPSRKPGPPGPDRSDTGATVQALDPVPEVTEPGGLALPRSPMREVTTEAVGAVARRPGRSGLLQALPLPDVNASGATVSSLAPVPEVPTDAVGAVSRRPGKSGPVRALPTPGPADSGATVQSLPPVRESPRPAYSLLDEPSDLTTDTSRQGLSVPLPEARPRTLTDPAVAEGPGPAVVGRPGPAPSLLNEPSEHGTVELPSFATPSGEREVFGARAGARTVPARGPVPSPGAEPRPTVGSPRDVAGQPPLDERERKTRVLDKAGARPRLPSSWLLAAGLGLAVLLGLLVLVSIGGRAPPGAVPLTKVVPRIDAPLAARPPAADPRPEPPREAPGPELFVEVPVDDGQGGHTVEKRPAGQLALRTDPTVEVFLGQRALGRTPVTVLLPAGSQQLRFRDKALGLNKTVRVEVAPHRQSEQVVSFHKGRLRVFAPGGTAVKVDGTTVSSLTDAHGALNVDLYEGEHVLETTLPRGKRQAQQVEIFAWSDTNVSVEAPRPKP